MTTKKADKLPVPTGIIDTWKLWRYCLCRHGWYPILVAPFVLSACLLDLYSSANCEFLRIDIGFDPQNQEWSKSVIDIGIWKYKSNIYDTYRDDNILKGCREFSSQFNTHFIKDDKAWNAVRIMAVTSGISGLIAVSAIVVLIICPLPAWFVWPGILLPAALIGFLSGGAKFFFLDADICQAKVWYFSTSEHRVAEACHLSEGAYFAIAALACYFICLVLIFYRVPEKRRLKPNFGIRDLFDIEANNTEQLRNEDLSESCNTSNISTEITAHPRSISLLPPKKVSSMHADDDDVEAVMAQIGEYFKASDIDFPSETIKEDERDQIDGKTEINHGNRIRNVEFELDGRMSTRKEHRTREKKLLPAHSTSAGHNSQIPMKPHRSRTNVPEAEETSTISKCSGSSKGSGSQSSKRPSHQKKVGREKVNLDIDVNYHPKSVPLNQVKVTTNERSTTETGINFDDMHILSPMALNSGKENHNNSRFRAY